MMETEVVEDQDNEDISQAWKWRHGKMIAVTAETHCDEYIRLV